MSFKEQTKSHKWENRVRDWLIMPHGALPSSKNYKQRIITREELKRHRPSSSATEGPTATSGESTMWMAVDGVVYDVTRFGAFHPGGIKYIQQYAGIDATHGYRKHHTAAVDLEKLLGGYRVGVLEGSEEAAEAASLPPLTAPPSYEAALKKSSGQSLLKPEDITAMAKKSNLFEGVSDEALLEAVSYEAQRASPHPEADNSAAMSGTNHKKEAEDEALLAIFDVLDKDGAGRVSIEAIAEFLVNIEACLTQEDAVTLVKSLAEEVVLQQGFLTKLQYLKLAEQL